MLNMAVVILLFLSSTVAYADDVREDQTEKLREASLGFIAEYPDGTKEQLLVQYEGFLHKRLWQTGEASKIAVKSWTPRIHLIDDRACHWRTQASVRRRAFLVSRSGILAPISGFEQIFYTTNYAGRGADNFFESLTYKRTCGDSEDAYKKSVARGMSDLSNEFEEILKKDQEKAIESIKNLVKAVKLKVEE